MVHPTPRCSTTQSFAQVAKHRHEMVLLLQKASIYQRCATTFILLTVSCLAWWNNTQGQLVPSGPVVSHPTVSSEHLAQVREKISEGKVSNGMKSVEKSVKRKPPEVQKNVVDLRLHIDLGVPESVDLLRKIIPIIRYFGALVNVEMFYSTFNLSTSNISHKTMCYDPEGGMYCSFSPNTETKFGKTIEGRDVVQENIVQLCLAHISKSLKSLLVSVAYDADSSKLDLSTEYYPKRMYWEYLLWFLEKCEICEDQKEDCPNLRFASKCTRDGLSHFGIAVKDLVDECQEDDLWIDLLDKQIQNNSRTVPNIFVNGTRFNRPLESEIIMEEICASMLNPPAMCPANSRESSDGKTSIHVEDVPEIHVATHLLDQYEKAQRRDMGIAEVKNGAIDADGELPFKLIPEKSHEDTQKETIGAFETRDEL